VELEMASAAHAGLVQVAPGAVAQLELVDAPAVVSLAVYGAGGLLLDEAQS